MLYRERSEYSSEALTVHQKELANVVLGLESVDLDQEWIGTFFKNLKYLNV